MPKSMHRRCKRIATPALAAAIFFCGSFSFGQEQSTKRTDDTQSNSAHVVDRSRSPQSVQAPIRQYIAKTWDTLTRSTADCTSLIDPKVATKPVLYLPADIPQPEDISTLESKCRVDVRRLPRAIHSEGDIRPEELKAPGLLYLPHPYVVPGGRFNEQYGWDSYFIVLGLISDGRLELARGMIDNFLFEIEHYGALLNANRTYYLTRSQPPLLGEMIREVDAASPQNAAERQWLTHAYITARRDYALWRTTEHKAGDTGLARYFDLGDGPVIEMADDSTYYPDAIRWMLAHPKEGEQYLVPASAGDEASCVRRISHVCAAAEVNGMRLSRDFYKGDRAMRESGFDTSFRFGPFSGETHHFAPVCLNSLLYRYEADMAGIARKLGRMEEARIWQEYADARKSAMDKYLWDEKRGGFYDYDFLTGKRSAYSYITALYPLWAGLATPEQSKSTVHMMVPALEAPHGLTTSSARTGMQWDKPFGWAPTIYFAVMGMQATGFHKEAADHAARYLRTVEQNYHREGTLREKYNVETGLTDVNLAAGYRSNNAGFGWTNGVYLRLLPLGAPLELPPTLHARENNHRPQLQSVR